MSRPASQSSHPFQDLNRDSEAPKTELQRATPFLGHVITIAVFVVGISVTYGRMGQRMDMYEANAERQRVTIEKLTDEIHSLGKIIVRLQTQQEDSGMDLRIDRRPR